MSLSDLRLFDVTLIITFVQRGSDVFSVGPTHVQALSLTPSLCDLDGRYGCLLSGWRVGAIGESGKVW